jgi:acetyl-CoA carboxylase biotin carboxyl carrier protein
MPKLECLLEKQDGEQRVLSPGVGLFTCALRKGQVLTPDAPAGILKVLGVAHELRAPAGAMGRVVSDRPERVNEPVGHGSLLYELAPLAAEAEGEAASDAAGLGESDQLAFRAPHSGRFWHRPSPSEPPLVEPGKVIAVGDGVGLIEVMKTFTLLHYAASGGLPERGRVLRVLAEDGAEIDEGQPLLELEPA